MFLKYEHGDEESQAAVNKLMPSKVKKRRKVQTEDGVCVFFSFYRHTWLFKTVPT